MQKPYIISPSKAYKEVQCVRYDLQTHRRQHIQYTVEPCVFLCKLDRENWDRQVLIASVARINALIHGLIL